MDHWWCILVAKYGAFLFTEIGAVVITGYSKRLKSSILMPSKPILIPLGRVIDNPET